MKELKARIEEEDRKQESETRQKKKQECTRTLILDLLEGYHNRWQDLKARDLKRRRMGLEPRSEKGKNITPGLSNQDRKCQVERVLAGDCTGQQHPAVAVRH